MQRNGEVVVVHAPEILKQAFRLAPRVDENQRGLMALDQIVNFAERMACAMPGPGQMLLGVEHGDFRCGGAPRDDKIGARFTVHRLWQQEAAEIVRLSNGGGKPDAGELRRQPK